MLNLLYMVPRIIKKKGSNQGAGFQAMKLDKALVNGEWIEMDDVTLVEFLSP